VGEVYKRRIIGLNFLAGGISEFSLWSPYAENVRLLSKCRHFQAEKDEMGYWRLSTDSISPGDQYQVEINTNTLLPDPASLYQREGVHGPSGAFDLNSFSWTDSDWQGLNEENIIYELHTGAFSSKGTFEGIIEKIGYLLELGVNTIEIMPVAQFPGERNWGYDGVFPFAVQNSYGGPAGLMMLVDTCHRNGIAVFLDVVYNHLGPEGNYLNDFGPYFTDNYKTPWGQAINFDGPWCDGVRQFYIENMLMWLRDFHIDGLRLDAVHAIKDFSANHIIKVLREKADDLEKITGKKYKLIGEIDLNDKKFIDSPEKGGFGLDKQWCDEFHHSLHALVTGERNGYYSDFGELWQVVKTFNDAWVYDGIWSPHRRKIFGSSAAGFPGSKFIVFIQNHDHIGNRMMGDRLGNLVSFEVLKLLAGAMFISPFIPLLFMGEEYNEEKPFLYFTSHTDEELGKLVSKGRQEEFPEFVGSDEFPDPQEKKTFHSSTLSFDIKGNRKLLYEYYRKLIRLKKGHPVWKHYSRTDLTASEAAKMTMLLVRKINHKHLVAALNFGKDNVSVKLPWAGEISYNVLIDSSDRKWGGLREEDPFITGDGTISVSPESIIVLSDTN
jgi:maltooligosyltrehalose trehalohydrolase